MHKKQVMVLSGCIVLALIFTFISQSTTSKEYNISADSIEAIIPQEKTNLSSNQQTLYEVYYDNELLGIVHDQTKISDLLAEVYKTNYEADFPDTEIGFSDKININEVYTYQEYENIDDEIIDYLKSNDLFVVLTNKVTFSNGHVAYVKNIDDFKKAQEIFIRNFVSKEGYEIISSNLPIPELSGFGSRELSYKVLEHATLGEGLASKSKILTSVNECLKYLSYGYDPETTYATVEEFDTIEGVAWKNSISIEHLMTINNDVLTSINQVLEVGLELNVSKLNSPIQVEVIKERMAEEKVYPEPIEYVYDDTLMEGKRVVVQEESTGLKNVRYKETYINGELISGEKMSELVTEPAQREIVRIGTKVIPSIGSGNFRYPVNNPRITCRWGCYYGHQALDLQDAYNRYGPLMASDRGVVVTNSYHYINGYYMVIDHQNGFRTYYGHMNAPGYAQVGEVVSKGQVIGQVGATGLVTGPHVHFEIHRNGVKVDPCIYLGC